MLRLDTTMSFEQSHEELSKRLEYYIQTLHTYQDNLILCECKNGTDNELCRPIEQAINEYENKVNFLTKVVQLLDAQR